MAGDTAAAAGIEARSRYIAGLAGPLLIAMAAGILLNRNALPELAAQIGNDYGLVFLSGALLLTAGIAIVRGHNVWSGGWPVLVMVIGWIAVLGGLARILYFRDLAAIAPGMVQRPALVLVTALVMLIIGVFLTLKGYRLFD